MSWVGRSLTTAEWFSPEKKGSYGEKAKLGEMKEKWQVILLSAIFLFRAAHTVYFLKLFGFRKRIYLSSHSSTCPLQQVASESTEIRLSPSLLTAD